MKPSNRVLAVTFLSVMMLIGCGKGGQQQSDILQPSPCAPPCWQNITPGETCRDEALRALRAVSWVQPDSIEVYRSQTGSNGNGYSVVETISWQSRSAPFPGRQGHIDITEEGIVGSITIYFDRSGPGVPVSIEDLITLYGHPLVQLRATQAHGGRMSFVLFLYYPETGLLIVGSFDGIQGLDSPVPSDILAGTIEYVLPVGFYPITGLSSNCSVPWDGYREAIYYCQCTHVPPELGRSLCEPWK